MPPNAIHLTEPELQDLRQKLDTAEDLTLILQRLDETDLLQPDPDSNIQPAHVATITPLIRMLINQSVAFLNLIESRTFSKGHTPKPVK